jgi:hypothetical protein
MEFGNNRMYTLASLGGGLACLLGAWQMDQPLILFPAAMLFFLSMFVWKFGFLLGPLLGGVGLKAGGPDWELVSSHDVLLQRQDSGWRAGMFLGVSLRDSASLSSSTQQGLMMELFEKAIGGLRYPLQLSVLVCPLDTSAHIQKLEERRSLCEHRRARLSGPKHSDDTAKLDREIESYNAQIRRLSSGERPMKTVAWAVTSASGLTREEAVSRVRAQAQESMAVLSGSLACSVAPLKGEELLQAVEWQKFTPVSQGELEDQTF